MRAALFERADTPLRIADVDDPTPAADEVVLQVSLAGICGSDLHMKEGGRAPEGTVFGHEFAGTIVAAGSDVAGWQAGQRITALPIMPCRHCEACDAGLPALCPAVAFVGVGAKRGAYAEYVAVRADQVQKLPEGISFSEGAMVEPLAVANHVVERAELRGGETVLVMGGGPIGMGVALFARMAGARHVILSEPARERRDLAAALGATASIDPRTENVDARCLAIAGSAPDVVFECVGMPGLLAQAVSHVRLRGRVIVAGVCFGEDAIAPLVALAKEITIRFSQCYTERNFAAVIDALAKGEIQVAAMNTRTVGFEQFPQVFDQLGRDPRECKVLLDPAAR